MQAQSPAIQITAPTGQVLYFATIQPTGQWWNATSQKYEAFNSANWSTYATALTEPIANTGSYFGNVPTNLPVAIVALLTVYVQAGSSPASTDAPLTINSDIDPDPLVLVLELDNDGCVLSLSKLKNNRFNSTPRPTQIPAKQSSLATAQRIVESLYTARLVLASQTQATITIDGQSVTFRDPAKLDDQILFWERKAALLSGSRRRVTAMRLDQH